MQWKRANNGSPATRPITISGYSTIRNPTLEERYTSNSDSDGDSISEPYLYEPEVEHPLHL